MQNSQNVDLQDINRTVMVGILITGAFVAILNQTLLATALPHIMNDLQITANKAQWLTSVFMLVNGVMIPITAFLIGKFTTRRLFLTAMGMFAIGTLICGFSPNFSFLIAGRIIQAAGAGIMMPLLQTVFFIIFPVEKRGAAMGMFGLVIAFAPAIGPTLSGWIVGHFPWRTVFFVVLPIVLIDLVVAYFALKNVTKLTYPKIDVVSIIVSTLGFGGILYGFSIAGELGWGNQAVIGSLVIGGISLIIFIIRQLKLEQPILEFRVFKYNMFALTTGIGMVVFMSMIGAATIIPIYMQTMRDYTALESGLMLLPGAIVMGLASPITGRIFDRIGAKKLAITGLSIMTITSFLFTNLTTETSFGYLTTIYAFRMLGIAMVMMPVNTAGINQLPKRLIPHGTAMGNTMRQVSGAIGTALLVTVMTNAVLPSTEELGQTAYIHGVNMAFMVSTAIAFVGVVLSFYVKRTYPPEETAEG
ncbi:MDR family MFS transporter [Evansella sp. AB-rgal1]|uniref:MDR family MFS transporter n=1 Tax=Evansella sp. AB-rgal1 TaxID=3242696 RepID=UPI00359CBB27